MTPKDLRRAVAYGMEEAYAHGVAAGKREGAEHNQFRKLIREVEDQVAPEMPPEVTKLKEYVRDLLLNYDGEAKGIVAGYLIEMREAAAD